MTLTPEEEQAATDLAYLWAKNKDDMGQLARALLSLKGKLEEAEAVVALVGTITKCANCDGSGKNSHGDCCRIPGHARECKC